MTPTSKAFLLLTLLAFGAEATNLDVEYAFSEYAHNYCSGGAVDYLDIGTGPYNSLMVTDKPGGTIKGVPKGLISGSQFLKENASNYSSDYLLGTNCDIGACSKVGNNWAWCNSAGGQTPYHCMGKYAGITGSKYTNIHTTTNPQGWMWTEWFDNDTDLEQSNTFSKTKSTSGSYEYSWTNTVSTGISEKFTVGLPGEFSSSTTISLDFSSSEGSTTTATSANSWTQNQQVKTPAKSTVKATMVVRKMTASGDFSGTMNLPDYARLWCHSDTNGHREWFVPADMFMPQHYPGICSGQTCSVGGKFSGFKGISSTVNLVQCKLYSRSC